MMTRRARCLPHPHPNRSSRTRRADECCTRLSGNDLSVTRKVLNVGRPKNKQQRKGKEHQSKPIQQMHLSC